MSTNTTGPAQHAQESDSPAKASKDVTSTSFDAKAPEPVDEKLMPADGKPIAEDDRRPKFDWKGALSTLATSAVGIATFPGSGTAAMRVNYYQRLITEQAIDALPKEAQRVLFVQLTILALNTDSSLGTPSSNIENYKRGIQFVLRMLGGKDIGSGEPQPSLSSVTDPDRQAEIMTLAVQLAELFDKHGLLHVWCTLKIHSLMAWLCMLPPAPTSSEAPGKGTSSQDDKEATPASKDG